MISDQLELLKRCDNLHPIKEMKKISPANIFIVNSEYHKGMWEDNEDNAETKEVNNIYRSSDSSEKPPYNPENQWKTLNCFNCDSGEHLIANCP